MINRNDFYAEVEQLLEENLDGIFEINSESIWHLEQELKNHPKTLARFQRLASSSTRLVNDLQFELDVVVAEIVEELYNSENPPPQSIRAEIRRTKVPLNSIYKDKLNELNKAKHIKDIMFGIVHSLTSKERRLKELLKLANTMMYSGGPVKDDSFTRKKTNTRLSEVSSEIEF